VCINKVDKPAARPDWVLDTTFDLFASLGADDFLCDFPVCYASGINGIASTDAPDKLDKDLTPLIEQILEECPKPKVNVDQPLQMLVANLDYDDYIGRICIGRLTSGSLRSGQQVGFQYGEGGEVRKATVGKLWEFQNNDKVEVNEILAGDICAFSGMEDVVIGDTVVDLSSPLPLPPIIVEEPTVVMEFGVNLSPFAGKLKESTKVTGSELEKRLKKECMTNLAVRVEPGKIQTALRSKAVAPFSWESCWRT
jgi:GTP-binding protein